MKGFKRSYRSCFTIFSCYILLNYNSKNTAKTLLLIYLLRSTIILLIIVFYINLSNFTVCKKKKFKQGNFELYG